MREPIFNAPACVIVAIAVLGLVHAALSLLPPEQHDWWIWALAFVPARYAGFTTEIPGGSPAAFTSFLTHQLVHGDLTHLLINGGWLLAFGTPVARRVGDTRFVLFSVLCGIAGAIAFLISRFGDLALVVGASGAISGLMGAAFRFFFAAMDKEGGGPHGPDLARIPLPPLRETLQDRRVLAASGLFILVNLAIAVLNPILTSADGIAWQAHLGGFFFGLLAFGLIDDAGRHGTDGHSDETFSPR